MTLNSFIQSVLASLAHSCFEFYGRQSTGLVEHIICCLGVHTYLRKLFLFISLPLQVNNSLYRLPLKFSRAERGARRIYSGC